MKLEGVSFSYEPAEGAERVKVLEGVELSVARGEFVGVVGATGSGKSTLLYLVNGVAPYLVGGKREGKVKVFGREVGEGPAGLAGVVGIVFQDPDYQLFSSSVREEVRFGVENLGVRGGEADARVEEALARVGLREFGEREPTQLSFGQKQKLAIACVLAMKPEVLLLDEPVSALDWGSAKEIYRILGELNAEGKTVVVVEHNTEFLAEFAERVVVLNGGRVALDAKPGEAFASRVLKEAGIKVPCAANVAGRLGLKGVFTPEELAKKVKRK